MRIKIRYSDLIVFIVVLCVFFLTCIVGEKYSNYILTYSILTISIIKQKFKGNIYLTWISVATMILIIITLRFNFINIILIIFIYYSFKDYISKDTIKLFINLMVIFYLFVIILYFALKFNINYDTVIWRNGIAYYRHSLGYLHPNIAATKWLAIIMGIILIIKPQKIFRKVLAILVFTYIIYSLTYSRTSTILIIALCFAVLILQKKIDKRVPFIIQIILSIFPVVFTILSLLITEKFYNSSLNRLLSGRLLIFHNAITQYKISLFGNSLIENMMFDNAYLQILLSKGIIYSCLFAILFFYLIISKTNMTYRNVLVISAYCIMGLMETSFFRFELLTVMILTLCLDLKIDQGSI
ncbi:hypothetical protein H2684_01690 [Clostridium sp. cel8]|jgi:hypothetical protein|uniref:hypothetical protein n=1 Tax=Clostridium sp. cel8 TaxID=2663123 RepID=UPI0015F57AB1|nr:hypothetical protein [Clostridium sp. cel8]MBA5850031.1 hypothetical protein [Clostridium sp. cel8]